MEQHVQKKRIKKRNLFRNGDKERGLSLPELGGFACKSEDRIKELRRS